MIGSKARDPWTVEDDTYSNQCGGSRIEVVHGLCHTPAEL